MRIAIVGTELCAVDARGGGLEQVLRRWAAALVQEHEVRVISFREPLPGSDTYEVRSINRIDELGPATEGFDFVSLHNRPAWVRHCRAAEVGVTLHNYPAAWKSSARATPEARLSAVSAALAQQVRERLHAEDVTVVPPTIDPAYLHAPKRRPERTVFAPNRLMRKKGVLDLVAVAQRPQLRGVVFVFTDLISPWLRPTAEHRELRAAIASCPNARLIPPARDPAELAARYARAGVVACPVREPEGLGLVALEAQACGAPLVTVDLGGIREATFAPNACIPPDDPDALERALLEQLARPRDPRPADEVRRRHDEQVFVAWVTRGGPGPAASPPAPRRSRRR